MILIILNSSIETNDFEHALELTLTMADMDIECMFMIMPEILDTIKNSSLDRVKKIRQLELFNVPTYALGNGSLKNEYMFIKMIDKTEFRKCIEQSEKVVTF